MTNEEKKKNTLVGLEECVKNMSELGDVNILFENAIQIAGSIQNDPLSDLSENRLKQMRDLNNSLMRMSMFASGGQGVISSLIALMYQYKVWEAIERIERIAIPDELATFFDEALSILKQLKID